MNIVIKKDNYQFQRERKKILLQQKQELVRFPSSEELLTEKERVRQIADKFVNSATAYIKERTNAEVSKSFDISGTIQGIKPSSPFGTYVYVSFASKHMSGNVVPPLSCFIAYGTPESEILDALDPKKLWGYLQTIGKVGGLMTHELRFASTDQALQHLANMTGKRVKVAKEDKTIEQFVASLKGDSRLSVKGVKRTDTPEHRKEYKLIVDSRVGDFNVEVAHNQTANVYLVSISDPKGKEKGFFSNRGFGKEFDEDDVVSWLVNRIDEIDKQVTVTLNEKGKNITCSEARRRFPGALEKIEKWEFVETGEKMKITDDGNPIGYCAVADGVLLLEIVYAGAGGRSGEVHAWDKDKKDWVDADWDGKKWILDNEKAW